MSTAGCGQADMASRILFVPLSTEASPTIIALRALCDRRGRSLEILDERATDERLAERTADIVVIKQLDLKAFTPAAHDITVVVPSGSDAFVEDLVRRHPDMSRPWCLIHGSEGIASCIWLSEEGAALVQANGFTVDGDTLELEDTAKAGAAPELALYSGLQCRGGASFDITAQTIANSPNLAPDKDGWHDLSGRAAHVVCGPYFFLPKGSWKIDIDVDVDCQDGHVRLFFEWGSPSGHRTNFESILRESGRYAVTLETDFDRPDAAHCLIATNASHLQGRMRLHRCAITRLDTPGGESLPGWA